MNGCIGKKKLWKSDVKKVIFFQIEKFQRYEKSIHSYLLNNLKRVKQIHSIPSITWESLRSLIIYWIWKKKNPNSEKWV